MAFKLPGRRSAGAPLRPVEIGRRILRAMDSGIDVDVKGRRVAPNVYRVNLSTADRAGLGSLERSIVSELVDAAGVYAADEGYHLLGPVRVEIHTDDGLTPGQFTVDARAVLAGGGETPAAAAPAAAPAPVVAPEPDPLPPPVITAAPEPVVIDPTPPPMPAMSAPATPSTQQLAIAALMSSTGTRTPLYADVCTLGRATENTISLPDAQASRRHAEIRYENGRHVLVDMNSTNGTTVNGSRISGPRVLTHGDVIAIGAIQLRYEAS